MTIRFGLRFSHTGRNVSYSWDWSCSESNCFRRCVGVCWGEGAVFLVCFFFAAVFVQRVFLIPALALFVFLDEVDVAVGTVSGEQGCCSNTNIGSPSSSKKFVESILH